MSAPLSTLSRFKLPSLEPNTPVSWFRNMSIYGEPVLYVMSSNVGGKGYSVALWSKSYALPYKDMGKAEGSGDLEYLDNTCPICGSKTDSQSFEGFQNNGSYIDVSSTFCTSCDWGETY